MGNTLSRAREHQVVFCGLEVLRLIADRMDSRNDVDSRDLQTVLDFMRDVAHRCLDNTEDILRFASLEQNVVNHRRARTMFEELSRDLAAAEFSSACRCYTDLLAQAIFEDRRCLSKLDCDPATLSQFYEWEQQTAELARSYGRTLHQLEIKYTIPHCI
jgi:hypothetical protein